MTDVEEVLPPTGLRAVLHVIRQRNFGPFFVGNAVSSSGTWFQNLAASVFVYRETGSELLLGVLNFSQFAAVLLLAPWAGSVADRLNRRHVTMVTQSVSAVLSAALAALAFTGHATTAIVIAASVLLGIATAFSSPAQMALVTSLVQPRDIPTAVALNSMTFNLARAVGPVLAALVISTLGIPTAFLLNALSYLVLIAALLIVRPVSVRERPAKARLRDSLALVRRNPRLAALLMVVLAASALSDPINTLAPAFAANFGFRDVVGGVIVGAFGFGAVGGALATAGHDVTRRRLIVALVVAIAGMVAFSLSPSLWVALAFLPVAGFGFLMANASATARLQLSVDESERGRIMALWSIAFLGVRPFASLLDGAIAAAAGVRVAALVLTLPAVAAAVLLWRRRGGAEAAAGAATGS